MILPLEHVESRIANFHAYSTANTTAYAALNRFGSSNGAQYVDLFEIVFAGDALSPNDDGKTNL